MRCSGTLVSCKLDMYNVSALREPPAIYGEAFTGAYFAHFPSIVRLNPPALLLSCTPANVDEIGRVS